MKTVLVSAALALTVMASGAAFAAEDIDVSLYEETSPFATYDVVAFMPSGAPLSADTAALYDEATVHAVALEDSVNLRDQLASMSFVPGRDWGKSIPMTASQVQTPE